MQVAETVAEGLKRELKISIPAADLDGRLQTRLEDLKDKVRLNGFRPGKVPIGHLRKVYGKSAMAEIVQEMLNETSRSILEERSERAAMQPKFDMTEDEAEANKILDGKADLEFTMAYEVLPDMPVGDLSKIAINRPIVEVADADIEEELNRLADNARPFEMKKGKAKSGDRVTMSYLGKVDGEPFEGGADEDANLVIGSGRFIPGFEEQLDGLKAGDEKVINITFPDDYGAAHLAGKEATFDIEVKEVAAPGEVELNDELAKSFGAESLDNLKEMIKTNLEGQYGARTRQKIKRQLLDQLDEMHQFDLPPTLVEQEFTNVWQQVEQDMQQAGQTFEEADQGEEETREEYRKISERRVRLGLLMQEIGTEAAIQVTEEEVQGALMQRLRQFPGQEQEVFDFYRNNPEAMASIRAPVFEEKVVDHILISAAITDQVVSKDELLADDEEEDA